MTHSSLRRPLPWMLLAGALLVVSPSQAQDTPKFQPAALFTASQVSARALPNGVRGVVKPAGGSDLVSVQVWVRAGSRYESSAESGAAHVVELSALRASAGYPQKDDGSGPTGVIEGLGGTAGSLTSRDSTFYSALVAAPYAPQAIKALADAVLRPDLTNGNVEESKVEVQEELTRRGFDGVTAATDLAYATAYTKHPYSKPTSGTMGAVSGLNAAKVKAYHKRQYVGSNISVIVVGDITADAAHKLIAANFGAASAAKAAPVQVAAEAAVKSHLVSRRARVLREAVVLAWRSPGIKNPVDVVALDTLLALWRESSNANLRRLLMRDGEKGPNTPLVGAYDVDFLTQRDPGLFIISLADPADKEAAARTVLDEVKRIGENGVSDEELKRGKELLRRQYIEQGETPAGQAGALGFYEMIDTYKFAVNYLDLCNRITAEDLQRAVKRYLTPSLHVRADIDAIPMPNPNRDNENRDVITAKAESERMLASARIR